MINHALDLRKRRILRGIGEAVNHPALNPTAPNRLGHRFHFMRPHPHLRSTAPGGDAEMSKKVLDGEILEYHYIDNEENPVVIVKL